MNEAEVDAANERAWSSCIQTPQSTLEESERTLAAATDLGYARGRSYALLNIGWSLYYLSRLPGAYDSFVAAQRLFEELGDVVGLCRALNALGVYNHFIFRLDKAVDFYTKSLDTAKANGIKDREIVAMGNIGELCLELGNPQEALEYLIPAYDEMPDDFNQGNVADCLRNIGQCFLQMDNLLLAGEFTRKSYELAKRAGETIIAADSLETLATVSIALGELAEAERLVATGLSLAGETGNLSQRASLLIVRGTILNCMGRPGDALVVLLEAAGLCQDINLKSKLFKAHEQLSKSYEYLGDHSKALEYYKRFAIFRAQVQHEDSTKRLRSIQTQTDMESARQEAEIYRLRNIDLKGKTEELEEINSQIVSISRIGRRVTASLDFNTVVQTMYDCLKPFLHMDMFGIALYDGDRNQLVYKRYYEDGERRHEHRINADSESSFAAWAFRNRKPVLIANKDAEYSSYLSKPSTRKGAAAQSVVCMPLAIEGRIIGVMTIQNHEANAYAPKNLSFIEALAPYVGIAVENAIIHDRLEILNKALSDEKRSLERATLKISHLANHDTLTGLPNRRLLFELMAKSVESARRTGGRIGVVFIDLDDFKPINDRFGHAAGDSALVAMSDRLRGLVRASDIVARIGGDEFVAVITNVKTRESIEMVARKVLDECSKPLSFSGKSCLVGMSMGISVFPDDGEAIEDLVNRADAAMYGVKHVNKNAYAFSSDSAPLVRRPD
ncbi:MAG: GGDEF domain-containing protein [Spirochaetes bacterium]|nr:GGDEF domain-containing protein [Spirochaetota bacterium]MBU1081035.1 GGDEF domain-containing protein [Spirochaetota bacterium]